ncbi:MAG: molybdate ABC transporter substrate-binding protein [Bacteroidota bacterium]|nr:molybdate ABC transporter substrate-binding protein [Candidatus Kapabacteria bacterium]MDW8220967.1 molybdate ABC transporter substrate-binding protein [Bacteroidota bacterium]
MLYLCSLYCEVSADHQIIVLRIAAAADLQPVLPEVLVQFSRLHPNVQYSTIYGSSGNLTTQILSGAPFDLFFSADMRYPDIIYHAGLSTRKPQRYAHGQLALWIAYAALERIRSSWTIHRDIDSLHILTHSMIRRIAIPNPHHAPYGERAYQALQARGLWNTLHRRLLITENTAQAAQYAATGNTDAAFLPLSLALQPLVRQHGVYMLVHAALYRPLEQGVVVLQRSRYHELADALVRYICSPEGARILKQFGFLP